jgi:geranylgeranyl pyrophosphate synthase
MYNKNISKTIETRVSDKLNGLSGNNDINGIAAKFIAGNLEKYSKFEVNTFASYPVKIAMDNSGILESLAYDLAAIWTCYIEALHIFDAIQDGDNDNLIFQLTTKPQAINIANLLLNFVQESIAALDIGVPGNLALLKLFHRCTGTMFEGQWGDINCTENMDTDIDVVGIARRKSGAAHGASMASVFVASAANSGSNSEVKSRQYFTLGEKIGTLSSIFSDYCDIWLHPYSDDLKDRKMTMPITAALKDKTWGRQVKKLLQGDTASEERQLLLRRFLAQTRAVEELKEFSHAIKKEIDELISRLPYLNVIREGLKDKFSDIEEFIMTLEEIRKISSDEFSPSI